MEMKLVKAPPDDVRMQRLLSGRDHPEETFAVASRIFHVNAKALTSRYYVRPTKTKSRKKWFRGTESNIV